MKISLLLICLPFAACQTVPQTVDPTWQPLEVLERFDASYSGSIGAPASDTTITGAQGEHPHHSPRVEESLPLTQDRLQDLSADRAPLEELSELPLWDMQVRFYQLDSAYLSSLLGSDWEAGDQLQGWVVSKDPFDASIEGLLTATDASVVTAPRLANYDAQPSEVSVTERVAFIRQFEIERTPSRSIADPEVAVIQSGVLVGLTAQTHGSSHPDQPKEANSAGGELTFEWSQVRLLHMQDIEAEFSQGKPMGSPQGTGHTSKIMLQFPVCLHEQLKGSVPLTKDRVAILPPLFHSQGDCTLAVLHLAPARP